MKRSASGSCSSAAVSGTERHRNSGTSFSRTFFRTAGTPALRKYFWAMTSPGHLAPADGDLDRIVAEHDRAVRVPDLGHRGREFQRPVSTRLNCCESAFDLHLAPSRFLRAGLNAGRCRNRAGHWEQACPSGKKPPPRTPANPAGCNTISLVPDPRPWPSIKPLNLVPCRSTCTIWRSSSEGVNGIFTVIPSKNPLNLLARFASPAPPDSPAPGRDRKARAKPES